MAIEIQEKKVMNFHSVKSLSYFMLLQVGHFVKGFMSGVGQLTSSSSGLPKASFFCVCRKLHVTQKNAPSGSH